MNLSKSEKLRPARAVYLLATLTIIAIAMLVVSLLLNMRSRDLERSRQETASLTRMLMSQTEQSFHNADLALRGVQDRLQTPYGTQLNLDSPLIHLLLNTRITALRQVSALFIVDENGVIENSSNQDQVQHESVVDRDYFKFFSRGKETGLFISRPVKNDTKGSDSHSGWTLYLSRRVEGLNGKFRGVVVAIVDLAYFEQFYADLEQDFQKPIGMYLNDGTLIASLPHRESDLGKLAAELRSVRFAATNFNVRDFSYRDRNDAKQVFTLGYVSDFPLLVSVTNNDAETLAAWRETAITVVLGALLVCIFISIAAALLAIELRREGLLSSALQEADDRYRLTIDSVMDAIISTDEAQNIIMFNTAAEHMFGMSATQIIGKSLANLLPIPRREAHHRHMQAFMTSAVSSRTMALQMEICGLRADGSEFPIESAISQTVINGKPQLTAVLRDITDRRRKETALNGMNSELRRLSISLQSVREEERARISRELHDDLGQQLTGLKLELAWFSGRLKDGRETAPEMLDSMRCMLDGAIVSVRRISTELRPRILDDLDLGEAISWQVEELGKRGNMQVVCNLPAAPLVKGGAMATALFRIVQEALTNAARHAETDWVEVGLVRESDDLILSIRDSGKGFVHDRHGSGIGLVGMRERATALGGKFTIVSEPGQGTTIQVRVPFAVPWSI
ncbi:MAG: PAS domain-containing sensor histidine kinase [Rhodanobacter sp.]|nr:MAG: PAS domain-containing sensor histidine kinase [Rhodanobacter sp.]